MKTIELNDTDAAQVRAILRTHAEMQDRSSLQAEEQMGDCHEDDIDGLQLTVNETTRDCDNLKRIADLFI